MQDKHYLSYPAFFISPRVFKVKEKTRIANVSNIRTLKAIPAKKLILAYSFNIVATQAVFI